MKQWTCVDSKLLNNRAKFGAEVFAHN